MKIILKALGIISMMVVLVSFGAILWRGYLFVDPYFHGDPGPSNSVATLAELEERASNVIRGRVNRDSFIAYSTQGRELANAVTVEIVDVIKGDIEVGSVIRILEPYFIRSFILYTYDNYLPSKANREYFFFLGRQFIGTDDRPAPEGCEGAYWVTHGERGRYLVPKGNKLDAMSYSRSALSLGKKSIDVYMRFYQSVIDNYIVGIDNKTNRLIEPRVEALGRIETLDVQGPFPAENTTK